MEKAVVLLISVLLLGAFYVGGASAADESGVDQLPFYNEATHVQQVVDSNQNSSAWKQLFLTNPILGPINSFLMTISIVFFVLFAHPYALTFELLLILVLWFFFWGYTFTILRAYSTFSSGACWGITFCSTVALAHLGLFSLLSQPILWLFFAKKAWWASLLVGAGLLVVLILLLRFLKQWAKNMRISRREKHEQEALQKVEIGAKFGEGLKEGLKK